MLFNSLEFLIFFVFIISLYFTLPHKYRWILLLVSSYYFYMCWRAEYVILIIISTFIDYFSGILIEYFKEKRKKRIFLLISLFINLGLLFTFKYYNFFTNSLTLLFKPLNMMQNLPSFNLLLPVGISFYTFQTLSYTIDVYRGQKVAEKHFGIFALYVSFFPQLVAGPIERSTRLIPQFHKKQIFDYERVRSGLLLMLVGFFKKVVVADNLSHYVDSIFNHAHILQGPPFIFATIFFGFQIYCDFSGYSDIAIGVARIMGFDLMKNFNLPYFSKSIREFWGRWHISLSSWFKDYVYFPLGGNRVKKSRWIFNIFIVFALSGLWHGANWTFIIWGLLHSFYYMFSIGFENPITRFNSLLKRLLGIKLANLIRISITYIFVHFAWIFFRANSLKDALHIVSSLTKHSKNFWGVADVKFIPIYFFLIGILIIFMILRNDKNIYRRFVTAPLSIRWSFYLISVIFIIMFHGSSSNFIYFQF